MYKVENHKWTNYSHGNLYLSVYLNLYLSAEENLKFDATFCMLRIWVLTASVPDLRIVFTSIVGVLTCTSNLCFEQIIRKISQFLI